MIKAVFLDFDYTIYSHSHKCIPQSTIDSLNEIHSKGIKVFMATGRNMLEMQLFPDYKKIPFDGYITLNGQLCLDKNCNKVAGNPIKGETLQSLLRIFNDKKHCLVFVEEKRIYSNYMDPIIDIACGEIATLQFPVDTYKDGPLYLAVAYIKQDEEEEFLSHLEGCCFQRWGDLGVDIVCAGMDKSKGIELFLNKYGIKRQECMTIGDSFNDIGMVQFAGIGVAMGNATQSLKDVSDYVTADIMDDGIEKALKHFNLL